MESIDKVKTTKDSTRPFAKKGKKNQSKKAKKVAPSAKAFLQKEEKMEKVVTGSQFNDINMRCYHFSPSPVSPYMSSVTIDTRGVICQLLERTLASLCKKWSIQSAVLEIKAFCGACVAILQNLSLGAKYGDLPSDAALTLYQYPVLVRKDLVDIIHATAIPVGNVFIARLNKSFGNIFRVLTTVAKHDLKDVSAMSQLLNTVNNLITKESYDTVLINACTDSEEYNQFREFFDSHQGTKFTVDDVNKVLRIIIPQINAVFKDLEGTTSYVPVTCQQSEIAYLVDDAGLDLVTYQSISQPGIIKRLKVNAMAIRFYIGFQKVHTPDRFAIDLDVVERDMLDEGLYPILEKYGIKKMMRKMEMDDDHKMVFGDKMESEVVDFNPNPMYGLISYQPKVEATGQVAGDFAFKESMVERRKRMITGGWYTTVDHLKADGKHGYSVSNDGIVVCQVDKGTDEQPMICYLYAVLLNKGDKRVTPGYNKWAQKVPPLSGERWMDGFVPANSSQLADWVKGLPKFPTSWK